MSLAEALALFRRLRVNVEIMTRDDFRVSYFALAKRYHPGSQSPQCAVNLPPQAKGMDQNDLPPQDTGDHDNGLSELDGDDLTSAILKRWRNEWLGGAM
jgi:hypothetical protein